MARIGVAPGESVVLEDSSNGALAGKRAGAYVIAVPSQYTRDQDFSFAEFRAADLREAAEHVRTLTDGETRS
jgi:beta-phosphoglucomutase-like phosphatase (HAD superfamily)